MGTIAFVFGFLFGSCFVGIVWAFVKFVIQGEYKLDKMSEGGKG